MQDVEQSIRDSDAQAQAAGTGAPRVTYDDICDTIVGEVYFTAQQGYDGATNPGYSQQNLPSLGLLTICVLVLRNGFTVTGESACASPENFNAEYGRELARKHAVEKVWTLEAYALRNRLSGVG